MKSESPVLLKLTIIKLPEVNLAEGTDYLPLYALEGTTLEKQTTVRFKLTFKERLTLLFSGNLWLQQLTFSKKYPPCRLFVKEPLVEECL